MLICLDVENIFPGPYLCYYNLPTPALVQQAHEYILDIMDEEGPFDGVIGFSQGAALAASMILQHAKACPMNDLFKVAIFAGASLPYNLDDISRLSKHEADISEIPENSRNADEPWAFPTKPDTSTEVLLGRYHPEVGGARIAIPTVHIIGEQDQFAPQSRLVAKLCSVETRVIIHNGGHRMPRERQHQMKAVGAVQSTIDSAYFRY